RARLDAVGDLPAAGALHEAHGLEIEQVGMAVAAPREAEVLGEEALAQLDDPRPADGEEVVVEEDVAHAERGEPAAERHDVVDAMEATAPAGGGAVAEGAGKGTAARRDDAGDGRMPVVEDVGLEAQRELGEQVPGRGREPVERV